MKPVVGLLLVLGAGFWTACIIPARSSVSNDSAARSPQAHASPQVDDGWRRTAHGWERRDQWRRPDGSPWDDTRFEAVTTTRLHPIVVAAFISLVSVGALVAGDSGRRGPATRS